MKINFEPRKSGTDQKHFNNIFPSLLITYLAHEIMGGITNLVTAAVTVVVTILIIIGGLWLAYTYLPVNIFYIILAVVIADITLGIVLRAIFFRR